MPTHCVTTGGQMVSVSSLLAAQRSLQQGAQARLNTAIKIQGTPSTKCSLLKLEHVWCSLIRFMLK